MNKEADDEFVKGMIALVEQLEQSGEIERYTPTPVDKIIREILDSFNSIEECKIVDGPPKNADVVKYFESNPELMALVKADDRSWSVKHVNYSYLTLHGGASYMDVAQVIAALFRMAEHNAADNGSVPPNTIKALCAEFPEKLSGGLAFLANRRIWREPSPFASLPSDLSAWLQLYKTGYMPWEGEGSDQDVIVNGDSFEVGPSASIYEALGDDYKEDVILSRIQLKAAIESVQQDLRDFLVPLHSWAQRYYPEYAVELTACFAKAFIGSNDD